VSLKDWADAVLGISLLTAMFMFFAGLASLFSFLQYLEEGEVSVEFVALPCVALGGLFIIVALACAIPVARVMTDCEVPAARRAAYFCLLFPVLLVSFLFATPRADFAPSVVFSFPLLLVGAVLYPMSAVAMRRHVRAAEAKHLLVLQCFRCSYQFEMHRGEPWIRCPYCGQVNMNPAMNREEEAPPRTAEAEERVSP
jgi:hypothetical protein